MKVFISYAREDREIAERVWSDLKRAGIDAWIDRKELLPGQNWKTEIGKAIRASSHFIALLSTRSVSKQGFFQTELKKAIDVLDTFPEHRIYFIPVRIDNCEPSYERLDDIHWADLFPSYEDGLNQILRVIAPNNRVEVSAQSPNFSEKQLEAAPIIITTERQPAPLPQIPNSKYQLRREPIITDDLMRSFRLNKNQQPLEYIQHDYKDNKDGTITDFATGLMWQKSGSDNYMIYENAKVYIEELRELKENNLPSYRLNKNIP